MSFVEENNIFRKIYIICKVSKDIFANMFYDIGKSLFERGISVI